MVTAKGKLFTSPALHHLTTLKTFLATVLSIAQLTTALLAYFGNFGYWFFNHPYIILICGWLISVGFVWSLVMNTSGASPWFSRRLIRVIVTTVITIATILGLIGVHRLGSSKGPETPLIPPFSYFQDIVIRQAHAESQGKVPATLVRWALVTSLSSLSSRSTSTSLIITPDRDVLKTFREKKGEPGDDPQFHSRIVTFLRQRIQKQKLPASNNIFLSKNTANLVSLTLDHSDLISKLLPTPVEFSKLKEEEAETVQRWVTRYVGQWRPRLRFTVDNTKAKQSISITSVIFNVTETGVMKGTISVSPQIPGYSFSLKYEKGKQEFKLAEQGEEVQVAGGVSKTFDIVLEPAQDAPAAAMWVGQVSLMTNLGVIPVGRLYLETYNCRKAEVPAIIAK
jgi:hypothetical protein